jgi:hypothetical protein
VANRRESPNTPSFNGWGNIDVSAYGADRQRCSSGRIISRGGYDDVRLDQQQPADAQTHQHFDERAARAGDADDRDG